jgi:PhnB protein
MLMGNDVPASMGQVNERENRSKIYVNAESLDEAEKIFNGLSAGGDVEVPWNSNFGMFRDKYGIEWIVNFEPKL